MLRHISFVLLAGLTGGCALNPGLAPPDAPTISERAAFSAHAPLQTDALPDQPSPWWRQAVAEDVGTALEDALAASPQLGVARADVAAAQARLRQAEADAGPRVSLGASAEVQRLSGDTSNSRLLNLDGELPVDASGALDQQTAAAGRAVRAAIADAEQLESDLARDYLLALLDVGEADQRQALLLRQIEVAQTLLRLIELRFSQGLTDSIDVLQQRDQLAALRQQLPQARLDRQIAANRMREIAYRTPDQALARGTGNLPAVRATFPDVQPAELLQRRASLRARQARLAAADARFAAALADRWPTLRLSAGTLTRIGSGDVSTLISAALDAALTLFDSGGKNAIAAERRAQLVSTGQQYLADWIGAVIEVDNLILEEASLRERIALSAQRLDTAQALLSAAQRRYGRGVSDYLPVLEGLRGLQQQQRDHLTLQADLARVRVRLHHALGHPAAEEAT